MIENQTNHQLANKNIKYFDKCFENGGRFWEASGSQVKHKEIESNLVGKMGKKQKLSFTTKMVT